MKKRYHFIAIGGAAMHNLAIALHQNGHTITGSDDQIFDPSKTNLKVHGLLPETEGWFPEKITHELDAVIVGMHARADNPELIEAQKKNIPILSFPEFIFNHSRHKKRIVIGGSHGKTTITGMILHVMKHAGMTVDYLLGAAVYGIDGNVKLSDDAKIMIIEGDEYLTSPIDPRPKFHLYKPHVAVISGIAWDHINVFKTFEEYKKQFLIFTQLIEPDGTLIYCIEDEHVKNVADLCRPDIKKIPYTTPPYSNKNGTTYLHTAVGHVALEVFGKHNLQNIEAARQVCLSIGINENEFYRHISSWKGALNRLTKIQENEQITVFRDFAHAPSKVKATVDAVRQQYINHTFIACLELHTFSSLSKEFLPQYSHSMKQCDIPIVYYNQHAIELKKINPISKQEVFQSFDDHRLQVFTETTELVKYIQSSISDKTVILMMSSGNFDNMDMKF